MKTYQGIRTAAGCIVTVDGHPLPLRLDIRNHSPTGFEWGYGGSGPAQLALALLADCLGDTLAQQHYQQFKRDIICRLNRDSWQMPEPVIHDWLANQPSTNSNA